MVNPVSLYTNGRNVLKTKKSKENQNAIKTLVTLEEMRMREMVQEFAATPSQIDVVEMP
jgi:uncharacterized iron-regulated protein